jgi:hypothetical protein
MKRQMRQKRNRKGQKMRGEWRDNERQREKKETEVDSVRGGGGGDREKGERERNGHTCIQLEKNQRRCRSTGFMGECQTVDMDS